jgi:hypothetical protein
MEYAMCIRFNITLEAAKIIVGHMPPTFSREKK